MINAVKPFQKYSSSNHIFKVENLLNVHFCDTNFFQSTFDLHLKENKIDDLKKNWIIEKTEDSVSLEEKPFLKVLFELERSTYPLEITVDEKGVFLKANDHKKKVENWKLKTESLKESYNNADAFLNQYLSALESEEFFYKNKLKEPFWNLFFFAPSYMDNGVVYEEKITWFIKGLGEVECQGSIQAERRDYGFESVFKSEFNLPEILSSELIKKYKRTAKDYKVLLTVNMNYNSTKKYYFARSAEFSICEGDKMLYQENCLIK